MMLVEVEIPALWETFDFEVDEDARVEEVITQMEQTIAQKKRMKPDEAEKYLYAMNQEQVLSGEKTLREQGVQAGETLFLI